MKLIRRLLKKNNRGMSLVELICAVAILGLATSAIGGAMVVSARHYQRDSVEFEVQQEAQTTTNLVGNLIVDSSYAEWVAADEKLKITNNGVNYEIYKDDTTLKYYDGTNTGVLAENVDNFEVVVPADFQKDKNVMVNLSIKKDAKEFKASYNTTSRNGDLSNINDDDIMVVLSVEQNWVIEPNQEIRFNVGVLNVADVSEVGGLTLNTAAVPTGWDVDMSGNEVIVRAPEDANGYITFDVRTIDEVAGVPIASKEIRVDVRRVSGVNLTLSHVSGTATKANAEYKVVANVSGSNLDEGDSHYDDGVYEYVNPHCVDFSVSMTGLPDGAVESDYYEVPAATKVEDNVTNPNMIIRLKQDMPENSVITIRGIAKHPEGLWTDGAAANPYNKASKSGLDLPYGTRKEDSVEIICEEEDFVQFPHGLRRGDDFFFTSTKDLGEKRLEIGTDTASWFYRFRVEGSGEAGWSHYINMMQGGSEEKINAAETLFFHPDKKYEIDIILVCYNNDKKVVWPVDNSLFDAGKGFTESGFTPNWDINDASVAQTPFNQYGGTYPLDVMKIEFKPMACLNLASSTPIIGTKANPNIVNLPNNDNLAQYDFEFDPKNMKDEEFDFGWRIIYKYDEHGEYTCTSINGAELQAGNQPKLNLRKNAYGKYKIGMVLTDGDFRDLNPNPANMMNAPAYTVRKFTNVDVFDTEQGYMFLQFNGTP